MLNINKLSMMRLAFLLFVCVQTSQVIGFGFKHSPCTKSIKCNRNARYRTFDGSCNNLKYPTWGQAKTAQRRFLDRNGRPMVAYKDGFSLPRGYPDRLPSPRLVSNILIDDSGQGNQFDCDRTVQNMAFGQLMAHDIIETKINSDPDCCKDPNKKNIDICFPFKVPKKDSRFQPGDCKNFVRASAATDDCDLPDYREQINLITSYIDASFLYGSSDDLAKKLREPNSCRMKTDPGDLLPTIDGGGCLKIAVTDRCPLAGDGRNAETGNLGMSHLVWVREHNYICEKLEQLNPHWNHEKVFQETRRIVIAIVQHITYNHYLPTILDKYTMDKFGLFSDVDGFRDVYNPKVDASTRNGFGIGPWRFGHSQITPEQSFLKKDFKTIVKNKIENFLQSPNLWQRNMGKNVEDFGRWLAMTPANEIDNFLVSGVRNKLFFKKTPPGSDLASRNIQRGREQGTPGYNKWREFCGLRKFRRFRNFGRKYGRKLRRLYRSVNDVDLFIGGLLEKGPNGGVGPTFACVIGKQFQLYKVGDRYWYESSDKNFAFTRRQLHSIKTGSLLSKIWCRNFGIEKIQWDIFLNPSKKNPIEYCDKLPEVDLDLWQENKQSIPTQHYLNKGCKKHSYGYQYKGKYYYNYPYY